MKKTVHNTILFVTLLWATNFMYAQSPNLRTAANYVFFSSNGTISNTGATMLIGDVGTNLGTTAGYSSGNVTGTIHLIPDSSTNQCALDLALAYISIDSIPADSALANPSTFGNKMVLPPRTYYLNAATVFTDTLYLNAGGVTNAIFIIKVNGAFSTAAGAKVILQNGAESKNVYWQIEGAVSLATNTDFIGTIISHNGAINLDLGATLDGRGLTTNGAITTATNSSNIPLPITLLRFSASVKENTVILDWMTISEFNNAFFTIERSTDGYHFDIIHTLPGAGTSNQKIAYSISDVNPKGNILYYRLKQTDFDGSYSYSSVIAANLTLIEDLTLSVFPNPSNRLNINISGATQAEIILTIYDHIGNKKYSESIIAQNGVHTFALNTENKLAAGSYILVATVNGKSVSKKIIIQ